MDTYYQNSCTKIRGRYLYNVTITSVDTEYDIIYLKFKIIKYD